MTYSAASLAWAAREADRPHATRMHRAALAALDAREAVRGADLLDPFTPDREIRRKADHRADLLRREIDATPGATDADALARWLFARCADLGGKLPPWPYMAEGAPLPAGALGPLLARAQCPAWWRRQLRREVVRARETLGMIRGEVRARGQVYVTDDTAARRLERTAANRAMLEATEIESEDGEVLTLADAADASTSNKAIRRGELMTRITGCEAWATAAGLLGLFTTNTCPSRFHAQTMHGKANPKHDGSTPREAQAWLRDTWARCRAALARWHDRRPWCAGCGWRRWGRSLFGADLHRRGLPLFGFRVAEPHHDGCPHWHMLLWCDRDHAEPVQRIIRAHWLADDGDEPGAKDHRFKAMDLAAGQAAAYVAKYVAKNIDDAGAVGAEGHHDTDHEGQADHVGTGKAQRVEAWAAAWGIRQFQALGQPPVTVWRELRRIGADRIAGAHPAIRAAHAAVSREGERRADWKGYMAAQGGPMTGRAYPIRIARDDEAETKPGRYGEPMPPRPLGVQHADRPGAWVLSDRKEWKPRGTWVREAKPPRPAWGLDAAPQASRPPRSRVNNCTDQRPRQGYSAQHLARFAALHGPLRVELAPRPATRSPIPPQW